MRGAQPGPAVREDAEEVGDEIGLEDSSGNRCRRSEEEGSLEDQAMAGSEAVRFEVQSSR